MLLIRGIELLFSLNRGRERSERPAIRLLLDSGNLGEIPGEIWSIPSRDLIWDMINKNVYVR